MPVSGVSAGLPGCSDPNRVSHQAATSQGWFFLLFLPTPACLMPCKALPQPHTACSCPHSNRGFSSLLSEDECFYSVCSQASIKKLPVHGLTRWSFNTQRTPKQLNLNPSVKIPPSPANAVLNRVLYYYVWNPLKFHTISCTAVYIIVLGANMFL